MIGRAIAAELAGLRSFALPVTALFAMGGAMFGRVSAWVGGAIAQSELSEILIFGGIEASDVALPLALLANVVAAAYLFGRDFNDQTVEVLLTSPVRRESVVAAKLAVLLMWILGLAVLAFGMDAVTRTVLAAAGGDPGPLVPVETAVLAAVAAFATLPVVSWLAIKMRGNLIAVGAGILLHLVGMSALGISGADVFPWNAPFAVIAGHLSIAGSVVAVIVFVAGATACVSEIRRVDLV